MIKLFIWLTTYDIAVFQICIGTFNKEKNVNAMVIIVFSVIATKGNRNAEARKQKNKPASKSIVTGRIKGAWRLFSK